MSGALSAIRKLLSLGTLTKSTKRGTYKPRFELLEDRSLMATVFFVDDDQGRVSRGPVERAYRFGLDPLLIDRFHGHEIKPVDEHLDGPVL